MSCYETHKGVLKKVDTDNTRQYLFDLAKNNDFLDKNYSLEQTFYDSGLEDKYIIIKDDLYEWLSHERKFDEEDDFCNLIENQDKTISVHAQFYNGGICIDEVINCEWDNLVKSKELSADQLINLACKWLGYHHSNYIEHFEHKDIVSGACQTDLRAFLNKVKNIDYNEALKLAKQ